MSDSEGKIPEAQCRVFYLPHQQAQASEGHKNPGVRTRDLPRVLCCEGDMMGGDLCRDCPRRGTDGVHA